MGERTSRTNGRITHSTGYVIVRIGPGDWRYEHRVIWERAHGPIPPGYHVHHINGVRDDNRLENLELVNGARHNREHTAERHRNGSLDNWGPSSGKWRHDLDSDEIVRRHDSGESFRSIGRDLGAAHNVISNHYRRALEAA